MIFGLRARSPRAVAECGLTASPCAGRLAWRVAAPSYDESEWPIFRVIMPKSGMNERELEAHLRSIERLFLRSERFALLIDARGAKPLDAKQRQALAGLLRRCFERYPQLLVGLGFVLSSALERGILTAISWAAGRTYPKRTFRTPDEAALWLRAALRSAELSRG